MATKLKAYAVHVQIHVHEKGTTYPEVRPIDFQVTENLPTNVDAQKHLRKRISEELARNFAALAEPIANIGEDAPADDPLEA